MTGKIIRAHGGKAELYCLYGGGWHWRASKTIEAPRNQLGPWRIGDGCAHAEGWVGTMQQARKQAVRFLTPLTEEDHRKARETFGELQFGPPP